MILRVSIPIHNHNKQRWLCNQKIKTINPENQTKQLSLFDRLNSEEMQKKIKEMTLLQRLIEVQKIVTSVDKNATVEVTKDDS